MKRAGAAGDAGSLGGQSHEKEQRGDDHHPFASVTVVRFERLVNLLVAHVFNALPYGDEPPAELVPLDLQPVEQITLYAPALHAAHDGVGDAQQ